MVAEEDDDDVVVVGGGWREVPAKYSAIQPPINSTIQFQRIDLPKNIPIPKVVDPDVGNTLCTQS